MIALISDIHGNIEALDAVIRSIRADNRIDRIICLGDIIGYCPAANEVIAALTALEQHYPIQYNLGSHDGAALGQYQFVDLNNPDDQALLQAAGLHTEAAIAQEYFNADNRRFIPVRTDARNAMKWTLEHLTAESKQFLDTRLKPRLELAPGIISVHASPRDTACEYVRDAKWARKSFESPQMADVWICFVGHTHLPVVWKIDRADLVEMGGARVCMAPPKPLYFVKVPLDRDRSTYIINAGSVGQPRNRDPRACYMLFQPDERWVEHINVDYDIPAAAARIRAAGLSDHLADRLLKGD